MSEVKKHIRLDEVTLMRTILALLIVFMHSFTCYQGGWEHPDGFIEIPVYKWIARASFAFTLEAFVFISGYLYAFRLNIRKCNDTIGGLIINKLKRLMLPCVVFSALYFPLFYVYKGVGDLLYNLLNGCGHMWFLPMLFWCFIGCWLLDLIKIGNAWKLIFLVCLNLFGAIPLPFRLSTTGMFLFYFYAGKILYNHRDKISNLASAKNMLICWVVFIIAFIIFRPLQETITLCDQTDQLSHILSIIGSRACQLVYASLGTFTFYITVLWYTNKHCLNAFTIHLASCCFGIYLFQQFILKILYYKTGFAEAVGAYWLPWIGFIIAAILSFLLTDMLMKTRVGKVLIG